MKRESLSLLTVCSIVALVSSSMGALLGCSSDADALGVGAECTSSDECAEVSDMAMECLTAFKGGYCGLSGCTANADCPADSVCVSADDGLNYCFRVCVDKSDCNANRSAENEANCTSSVTLVEEGSEKVCVPPSGT